MNASLKFVHQTKVLLFLLNFTQRQKRKRTMVRNIDISRAENSSD